MLKAVLTNISHSQRDCTIYFKLNGKPSKIKTVPANLVYKKGCDLLIGDFLFGTEIGGGRQLKESPCISHPVEVSLSNTQWTESYAERVSRARNKGEIVVGR